MHAWLELHIKIYLKMSSQCSDKREIDKVRLQPDVVMGRHDGNGQTLKLLCRHSKIESNKVRGRLQGWTNPGKSSQPMYKTYFATKKYFSPENVETKKFQRTMNATKTYFCDKKVFFTQKK